MRSIHSHSVSLALAAADAVPVDEVRVTKWVSGSSAPVNPSGKLVRPAGLAPSRDFVASLSAEGRLALRLTGIAPQCIDESPPDPTLVTDLDVPFPEGERPRARWRARDPLAVG